jgi:hypothetical protein
MRKHGIENFKIELVEEFDIDNKRDPKIGEKELYYFNKFDPPLNMIAPKISYVREFGRIYCIKYKDDEKYFYIGSTEKEINERLSAHRSASLTQKTPFYTFMREKGRENFIIECIENNIPVDQLIIREDYWIKQLNPTLNKNKNLCITEKERDRLKYIKNKEKRLEQVRQRRLEKRDEINTQKREHYHANKERISEADKQKRKALKEMEIEIYKESPKFTEDMLNKYTIFELKGIAKRFGLKFSPRLKEPLVAKILEKQKDMFK